MGDDEGNMTETSIGDILNDEEPTAEAPVEAAETVETPVETTEAPPETAERPRGPDGKFIAKGETESAPPAPQEESGHIPIAALKDERSKRQALEAELNELRQKLAQPAQQLEPQQPEGPPDRWEDPEGYDQWLIAQASRAAREQATEAFNYQRIQAAAAAYQADKPDYQEVIAVFGQMTEQNPALIGQMQQAPNPAQFAYETAKLQVEIAQHGGLQGYIDAQIAAKQSEALGSLQGRLPQSAPPTIANERSVGARSGPAWSGPSSLGDILS